MAVKFCLGLKTTNRKVSSKLAEAPILETSYSLQGIAGGGTVILIHGMTGTPHEMRSIAKFLNQKGYTIICPRLANHGSPIEMLSKTTWEECYQSVREAFKNVQADSGPFFASGLSMGALLALLLADEFPSQIDGVSCLSPTLFYDGWNTPWARHLLPLAYITPFKRFFYFKEEHPYGIKNIAVRQRIHRYFDKAGLDNIEHVAQYGYPYFPVTLLCELHFLVKYLTPRLDRIKTPVQLIQAKEDDMTSVKNSQFVYDHIGSDIKELVLLYDSYHIITADQERDVVAQKVESFFSRLRNNGSA